MPHYSNASKRRLAKCHKDLQLIFNYVIEHVDCSVLCGHRGKKEQNFLRNDGKSQLVYPFSKHNKTPSLAVDVVPYPVDWTAYRRFHEFAGFVKGVSAMMLSHGQIRRELIWGGDWKSFVDMPHYELNVEED